MNASNFTVSIQALYDYKVWDHLIQSVSKLVSIQALYDYKILRLKKATRQPTFQFKHCTIISYSAAKNIIDEFGFQFKHCTIIRQAEDMALELLTEFQFKHCTIISGITVHQLLSLTSFNSSIVRL